VNSTILLKKVLVGPVNSIRDLLNWKQTRLKNHFSPIQTFT